MEPRPDIGAEAEASFQFALEIATEAACGSHGSCAPQQASPGYGTIKVETAEAYDLLAPVYDWFTEGFDTADLKNAKALLEGRG